MRTMFRTALTCACTWLCLAFAQPANAQVNDPATYNAYIATGDVAVTNALWDKVVAEKQEAFDKKNSDPTLRWNLALAQYCLMANTMRSRDEDRFGKYYKITEDHLQTLSKDEKMKAEANAILSAVYGVKIAYSSMMGMTLGPKSGGLVDEALKLAPESPLVWRIEANSKMFTPSMFGGDMNEAIKAFEKSITLFEKQPGNLKTNWLYLDTHIFLGQAYSSEGQTAKAIAIYEKVLKLEPNLSWVKNELLPKAKQKALGK